MIEMTDLFESMGRLRAHVVTSLLRSPDYQQRLDVGSGGLSEWYGDDERVIRVDMNPGADIDVIAAVEALPFKSEVFDLVIATELIEHVRYPLRMLAELHRTVKVEGHLLISTPNAGHLESRLAMLLLGYFLPDRNDHGEGDVGHIHFFDSQFLRSILGKSGFKVMKDLSDILHLGKRVWVHVPRLVPRSLCSQTLYLARKEA